MREEWNKGVGGAEQVIRHGTMRRLGGNMIGQENNIGREETKNRTVTMLFNRGQLQQILILF